MRFTLEAYWSQPDRRLLATPAPTPPQVLGQDTAAISALRCLKLYLERLGAGHVPAPAAAAIAGKTLLRVGAWEGRGPDAGGALSLFNFRKCRGVAM